MNYNDHKMLEFKYTFVYNSGVRHMYLTKKPKLKKL